MSNSFARVQNKPSTKRQTVPVTIWVKPIEKEDLERVATAEKISLSQAGRTLMRKGMQTSVEMRYASFLEPVIERVIARYLNNRDSASSPSLYVSPLTQARPEALSPIFSASSLTLPRTY
jgi:hypothetical protein